MLKITADFAHCRFEIGNGAGNPVRADLTIFHWTGAYYDTIASDDAR